MKELTDRQYDLVARICHAGSVAYQMGCGQNYNIEPDADDLASQRDAIKTMLREPEMTAERNHENWMRFRLSQGWRHGPVKDEHARTHPDLVPYDELPEVERKKDEMDVMMRRLALWVVYTMWPASLHEQARHA